MRKIIVLSFLSMDGVMQAPGGPSEDTSGDFKFGGWTQPYGDEVTGKAMMAQMKDPADVLLGRKTFEIFASFWPEHAEQWPGINEAKKYVVSNTLTTHDWENTVFMGGNILEEIRKLKAQDGPDLKVWGSSVLAQTLLKNDLVDVLRLKIFPVTLGTGKRLFGDGTIPAAFKVINTEVSPSGVIIADYERAGEVQTGSLA